MQALLWTPPSRRPQPRAAVGAMLFSMGSTRGGDGHVRRGGVVVGGGIAGLSAAWRLRHRDVLLLEAGDRLGGRLRSDPCGEYWLNYGAHLFPSPGSRVDRMATECDLEAVPVFGGMMGL